MKTIVNDIRQNYDVMFVIGIGGSYAGSKAGIEFLPTDFPVEFIGYGFETNQMQKLWDQYHDQRIKLCIISKSGQTLEIVSALEFMQNKFQEKYGDQCYQHMIAITGQAGKLRDYVNAHHLQSLDHPEDVGGRFSVLTVVGLFPMAVAGVDTDALLAGAEHMAKNEQAMITTYAQNRYEQYQAGKRVEVFAVSSQSAKQLGGWYQQLFAESEGKEQKGIWTANLVYSQDLHSMGQFIQQGTPIICETIINVQDPTNQFDHLNQVCMDAVTTAHRSAGITVTKINLPRTAFDLGRLFRLFIDACVLYCDYLGVNAYNQPGIEAYKNEMRKLLQNEKNN